jgi:hypothetical protein
LVDRDPAAIDATGLTEFYSGTDRGRHPTVDYIYRNLQVSGGSVLQGFDSSPILIDLAPGVSGSITGL